MLALLEDQVSQHATTTLTLPTSVVVSIVGAVIITPAATVIASLRWGWKQMERARADSIAERKQRDELVREMNAELRNTSNNNAQTAAVLATLATNVGMNTQTITALEQRVATVEHSVDEGVSASMGQHGATQNLVQELRRDLAKGRGEKPPPPLPKAGRIDVPTLFLIAAAFLSSVAPRTCFGREVTPAKRAFLDAVATLRESRR